MFEYRDQDGRRTTDLVVDAVLQHPVPLVAESLEMAHRQDSALFVIDLLTPVATPQHVLRTGDAAPAATATTAATGTAACR